MSNGQVITIGSTEAFDTLLGRAASLPVVIDFTATWCGPCKVIGPVYEKEAKNYPKAVFLKIDVDEQSELAQRYSISAMPTFILLKGKEQVGTLKGPTPAALGEAIKKHVEETASA